MTKLFSLFIILSFVLPVSGQEKLDSDKARKEKAYHLTGSVREQGERPYPDPLPDVNIQLYSLPDTSFIEGTVSDKKGVFRLYPMNPGNYLIRASFLGYETIEKKVNIPAYRKEVYGGALMMKPSSIVLDETVIKACSAGFGEAASRIGIRREIRQDEFSWKGNHSDLIKWKGVFCR